jgi:hypothetical protein
MLDDALFEWRICFLVSDIFDGHIRCFGGPYCDVKLFSIPLSSCEG